MFQVIPTIGTLIALAAFFFAVYYRTVQKYAQIGADSVRSIGKLPLKSRLDATKVLVNVFDLDVDRLTPDQQFQLALKTFEKRERDSKRNFFLMLAGGAVMLLFAVGYWLSQMDGARMVKTALQVDKVGTNAALNDVGYYAMSDSRLVDRLAGTALIDTNITDPFERAERFVRQVSAQPTVAELRSRAAKEEAPFQVVGDILNIAVPKREDQPPRYIAYVRRQSPLAGRLVSISAKGRDTFLRLYALGAVDSESRADVQLNSEQFRAIFGDRPNQILSLALVTPSVDLDAIDETCPKNPNFSVSVCDLPARIDVENIPARARR